MSVNRRSFLRIGSAAAAATAVPAVAAVHSATDQPAARKHLPAAERADQPIMLAASFALLPRQGWSDETLSEFKSSLGRCAAEFVDIRGGAGELVRATVRYKNPPADRRSPSGVGDALAHQIHSGHNGKWLVTDLKCHGGDGDESCVLVVEWLLATERASRSGKKGVSTESGRIIVKADVANQVIENNILAPTLPLSLPAMIAAEMALAMDAAFLRAMDVR